MNEGYARRVLALVAFLLTGTALILSLLFIGPRGNYTVSVLGLLATFVFGVLGVAAGGVRPPGGQVGMGMQSYIASMVAFAIVGGFTGYGINFIRQAAVEVPASRLVIVNADGLSPTAPATVVFAPPTPDKQYLGIKLSIVDYLGQGDCSTSPTASIYPYQGGAALEAVEVETLGTDEFDPSETQIEVTGSSNDLSLQVRISTRPGCVLRLEVKEAVFYA